MQTPNEYKYFEFVTGGLSNRNNIVDEVRYVAGIKPVGYYNTLWRYDKSFLHYVRQTGSVEKYVGKHTAEEIVFDFDYEEDLDKARQDALALIQELTLTYDVDFNSMGIYFSGAKGFHIVLPIAMIGSVVEPSEDFYLRYKGFIQFFVDKYETSDLSIYNPMRLIRIPNTVHEKTNLYKVGLSLKELTSLSITEILQIARQPREYIYDKDCSINLNLEEIWHDVKVNIDKKTPSEKMESNAFIKALSGSSTGGRHEGITKVAGYLIDKGVPYNECLAMLRVWNNQNKPPLTEERLQKDLKGMYNSYWDKRPKTIDEPSLKDILVYGQGYTDAYEKHIARISKYGRIKTGYPIVDEPMRGGIAGEVGILVGKTSIGKSALLQNILLNNAETGRRALFFSLEMPIANVAERNLQMKLLKAGREIEKRILEGDMMLLDDIKKVNLGLENFVTIPVQGIKYQLIERYIKETEDFFGEKIDLVGIDYAGLIKFEGGSLYEQQSGIAKDLKALAGRTETFIWNLAQVSKNYKEGDALDLDSTRDSGVVIEASDYVLGIWRANREYSDDIAIDGLLMKNRNGSRQEFSAKLNRKSLRYELYDRISMEDYHQNTVPTGDLF